MLKSREGGVSLAGYREIQFGNAVLNLAILKNRITKHGQDTTPFQRHEENHLAYAKLNLAFFNREIAPFIREPLSLIRGRMNFGHTPIYAAATESGRLAYAFSRNYDKPVSLTDEILGDLYDGRISRKAVEVLGGLSQVEMIDLAMATMQHPHLPQTLRILIHATTMYPRSIQQVSR